MPNIPSYDKLTSLDISGMFFDTYTAGAMAPFEPFFWGLLMMGFMVALYMKTEDLMFMGGMGMLMSTVAIGGDLITGLVPAAALLPAYFVMSFSVFVVLWKLFKG